MQPSEPPQTASPAGTSHASLWLLACALLALLQVTWTGYELGAGNQSIQVPFIERLHDASLFTRDAMVSQTLHWYPSFFFRLLTGALSVVPLPQLYLALHLLASAGVLVVFVLLCRAAFSSHWAGLVAILFLLPGHHRALAEETLYSTGFTHTWAIFPLVLAALVLLYAGRHYLAFALTGLLFNFHALEAGYVGLAMGFWAVCSIRELGWRKVAGLLAVLIGLALPTGIMILLRPQHFDDAWFQFMRIRSSQHSFPFSWWRPGQADVPRFFTILALAGITMSLDASARHLRKTLLLATAGVILFVVGTVFTEVWPSSLVVRAQLFRSSRFALALALAYLAMGCVRGWSLMFARTPPLARWQACLEGFSATFTAISLAVPSCLILLPAALVVAVLVALLNRRLFWHQAALAGVALLVCLVAWHTIAFILPGASWGAWPRAITHWHDPGLMGWAILAAAIALWWLAGLDLGRLRLAAIACSGVMAGAGLTAWAYTSLLSQPGSDPLWVDIQRWAREHTPPVSLFLTPAQPGGFRIHSQRSVVGEWRDGTQLYFSADYAQPWWTRMNALQPGMRIAPDGKRLLVQGRSLSHLDNQQVIALAEQYGAQYVVLAAEPARRLRKLHGNSEWTVYRPEIVPPSMVESGAMAEQKRFIEEVALPNIEKNRKSNARLQVVDPVGRPVYDARYRIVQTGNAFLFGASLPFFAAPADADTNPHDFRPPPVTPAALDRFLEAFNFSRIAYSAWWTHIEPREGPRRYEDLDRYLAWCKEHHVATEFSFLSGFPPAWLRNKPEAEQARRLLQHAQDLVSRYADRVDYWQATDQGIFFDQAASLINALRAKHPQLKLGISDAARFHTSAQSPQREADLMRGLDNLRRLKEQGVKVDFVSLHGHQPWGLWADSRVIYEVLDAFAKEGVRVHLTEFEALSEGWIEGTVRQDQWSPTLQAEYGQQFYTVCYSHPAVDVINQAELGPATRLPGGGLLEDDGRPKAAFNTVRELITQRWRTTLTGVVPLDGMIKFRGYHGDYELEVMTTSGKVVRAPFTIAREGENRHRFQLDAAAGTLTRSK